MNFEIVKAQTGRPLKLEYVHNKANILKAYIFAQTELNDFGKWIQTINADCPPNPRGRAYGLRSATECVEVIKQQLQDKEGFGIDEVKVFIDLSKAETIKTIEEIKKASIK